MPGGPKPAAASEKLSGGSSVRINLDELAARIAGSNLALRAVEAELDAEGPWTADRIAMVLVRLSELAAKRHDCLLFYELLSDRQRAMVGELETVRPVVTQVERRIVEVRLRAAGPDFPGTQNERIAELEFLDALWRTLAELAAGR